MFRIGDQIGSYFLIQKIGRGAFGEVWLAEEKTAISTHKVALKLPNEEDIDLEAIRQEAIVWESVKGHPNILPIIKADNLDGQIYIASEYAPDGSLSKWLKKYGGKAPTTEIAVKMIQGILSGLEHLHSKGVIHRDLKPENILLQSDTPRIADFGIARLMQATSNTAQATGTPSYMAPECFHGIRSVQSDIWAVGVIFHLLLTGKLPFPQPDQISVMNAILNNEPQIQNYLPENLQAILQKALKKDTIHRYQSALGMKNDLNFVKKTLTEEENSSFRPAILFSLESEPKEEETVVNITPRPTQNQPSTFNLFQFSKAVGIGMVLTLALVAMSALAIFQLGKGGGQSNSSTTVPTNATVPTNVQPVNQATGTGEPGAANKNMNVPNKTSANNRSKKPTNPNVLPSNSSVMYPDEHGEDDYPIETPTPRKTPTPKPTPISDDCCYNRRCN